MRISFHGRLADEPEIRAGFIGCGSHSFRNIYPTFQFAPVRLVATCDLAIERATAFAAKFGAQSAYSDYRTMLDEEELDAVFIVVGYDATGRPLYPQITIDCLNSGRHVWMEKPPAASCAEIDAMRQAAERNGRNVVVGLKKMFFPANGKAKALMAAPDFGRPSLVLLQYPQYVPTEEEFRQFVREGKKADRVTWFLDHLCHPASLLVYLLGMPTSLSYERSASGAGVATFRFGSGPPRRGGLDSLACGRNHGEESAPAGRTTKIDCNSAIASLALTHGASLNGGMERTTIISDSGKHIVVDNNLRVAYHRTPPPEPGTGYGSAPSFYTGSPDETTAVWEPEFSLGQLYNKGLFLLGYYNEVNEFARSILEGRPPAKGTLEHAWQVTRIFEAFAEGPGRPIPLGH